MHKHSYTSTHTLIQTMEHQCRLLRCTLVKTTSNKHFNGNTGNKKKNNNYSFSLPYKTAEKITNYEVEYVKHMAQILHTRPKYETHTRSHINTLTHLYSGKREFIDSIHDSAWWEGRKDGKKEKYSQKTDPKMYAQCLNRLTGI